MNNNNNHNCTQEEREGEWRHGRGRRNIVYIAKITIMCVFEQNAKKVNISKSTDNTGTPNKHGEKITRICTDTYCERAFRLLLPFKFPSISFRSSDLVLLLFHCVIRIILVEVINLHEKRRKKVKFFVILQIRLTK